MIFMCDEGKFKLFCHLYCKLHTLVRNIVFNQGIASLVFSLSQNQVLIIAHAVNINV